MLVKKHLYWYGYDNTERAISKLESKYVFNQEEKNKLLFSDLKVDPSSSAFIKKRIDIISYSEDYSALIKDIKKANLSIEGFKVEYFVFDGDTTVYSERLEKLRDIGYSIEGTPDYHQPTLTYALCLCEGIWCFGLVLKNNFDWYKHNQKPRSYSNSIGINIAKALVNIAAEGNKEKKLLDACCGVGTILLEACFAGNNIEGCDINWKICIDAKENLSHFNYSAKIHRSDIKDISTRFDAAIIDLPYNLLSSATDNDILHIIESTAEIADRLVIVSISDITTLIHKTGFRLSDYCSVSKKGKTSFARKIWVCDKES